jgi:immune inhibitor A
MAERLGATLLPGRDPVDLAIRFRGVPPNTPLSAPLAASRTVGQQEEFWVLDQQSARLFPVRATLQLASDHVYWYAQSDLAQGVLQADLERAARVFETQTYPTIHRYFGSEPSPGVDGDPRIVFLLAQVPGVAAYFSGADSYPRAVNPRSNERDIIYVNLDALRPGQPAFDATMAHEFQHMVHFARCPTQETWVDEGAAELATRVAGFRGGRVQQFAARPDVQLTTWSNQPAEVGRHYQAAYLFVRYVAERYGGWDALPELLAACAKGPDLFARFLESRGQAPDFDALFADWTVANLVNDPLVGDGRYAYGEAEVRVAPTASVSQDTPLQGLAPQYAAQYVELPNGTGTATFNGGTQVPLVSATPPSGRSVWWSNRADNLDSRITRTLDLRGLSEATLRFRAWYDLEDGYDYVYLAVSHDGGKTWQTVPGRYTAPDQAIGNNFGVGWTGVSGGAGGPTWVDEEVDLSQFAGSEISLRFEYVTDQGYNGRGFAFDGLELAQAGVLDDPETDGAWTAEGWLRVDSPLPQRWNLRLVRWLSDGVRVDPVPVDADGQAVFALDEAASRTVLVVAPTAPRTLEPGSYSLRVD